MNSAKFKYYIHDGTAACRLQLLGEVRETEVAELNSCWQTAKTTLGSRPVVLDVREVTALDDTGKKWFAQMVQDGAQCLPESFLRDAMTGKLEGNSGEPNRVKVGWLCRIISFLRGARVAEELD